MEKILEQIEQLKKLVENSNQADSWYFIVIIVGSIVGAFLGSFFKKKGENLATKSDIDKITDKVENIKLQYSQDLEKFKHSLVQEIESWKSEQEIIKSYRGLQHRFLEEVIDVVVRIEEIFERKFESHFTSDIDFKNIQLDYLEKNKKLTTIYRFLRLLGLIQRYKVQTGELPFHPIHGVFYWYINHKITPVLTSGGYSGSSVIWRDGIREIGENMIEYSDKWKNYKPLSISSYLSLMNKNDLETQLIVNYSMSLSKFFSSPSIRLALLGIYLIDINQDITHNLNFEKTRNHLLSYIKQNNESSLTIYGYTIDKYADASIINIEKDVKPRNVKSIHYDSVNNPCRYNIKDIDDKI